MKILKWKQMTKSRNFIFRRCCERHNGLLLMPKRYRGVYLIRKMILMNFIRQKKTLKCEMTSGFGLCGSVIRESVQQVLLILQIFIQSPHSILLRIQDGDENCHCQAADNRRKHLKSAIFYTDSSGTDLCSRIPHR